MGRVCAIISSGLFILGNSFIVFAAAFVFQALSYNLNSGTFDALLFESATGAKQEAQFATFSGRSNAVFEAADTMGILVAGWFVNRFFTGVYWLYILCSLAAIGVLLFINEPSRVLSQPPVKQLDYENIIKQSLKILRSNHSLGAMLAFDAGFSMIISVYFYFFQTLLTTHRFSGFQIGLLMAISAVLQITGSLLAGRVPTQPWQTQKKLLGGLICSVGLLLVGGFFQNFLFMLVIFLLTNFLGAVFTPLFSAFVNQLIPSALRATLLSFNGMLFSVMMMVGFPLFAWLIQRWTFFQTFGLLGLILLLVSMWLIQRFSH